MALSPGDFRSGMRQLAAAVNVITTEHEGRRAGMTATAVMSLTAEPPQLGVGVNRSNASYAAMAASGVFAVNVLPHDHLDLAAVFAGANGLKGEDRFSAGSWGRLETGAPILLDSVASFDCRIVQTVEFATHDLVVGLVEAIRLEPVKTPLLYIDGTWASLVRTADTEFHSYEQIVEGVAAALDAALTEANSPSEQLQRFSQAVVDLNADAIEVLRSFHSHEAFARADRLDAINRRKRDIEAKLRTLLVRGAEAGEFQVSDPAMTADAIIGMLNSIHRSPLWNGSADSGAARRSFGNLVASVVAPQAI